ncbi:MAG: glycoside hydrolase family 26 protein [Actinomycetales bacterium]
MTFRKLRVILAALLVATTTVAGGAAGASAATKAAAKSPSAGAVSLTPAAGAPGSVTSLTGSGFPRSAKGVATLGSASVAFTTSRSGTVSGVSLTVPDLPAGAVPVVVTVGSTTGTTTFTVITPRPVAFGVATPGGPLATSELSQVASVSGRTPDVVLWYQDFTQRPDLAGLTAVLARGQAPLLTWEPWVAGQGVTQPSYSVDMLASGSYDDYYRAWAQALASLGQPVYLRFAHEMNGTWYPWAAQANGNTATAYVNAWRHVHDVFAAAGATNVRWVWSPNVSYTGSTPLAELYPGDAYVDVVALDGYNWGTSGGPGVWQTASQIFDASLAELSALAPAKPVWIAETASSEAGGSKAAWVSDFFGWLAAHPQITTFVWFDMEKEADWRIDSSSTSAAAFASGLRALGPE